MSKHSDKLVPCLSVKFGRNPKPDRDWKDRKRSKDQKKIEDRKRSKIEKDRKIEKRSKVQIEEGDKSPNRKGK